MSVLSAIAEGFLMPLLPCALTPTLFPVKGAAAVKDAAERRHLTVMICDLVGSTALSARLDP